MYDGVGERRWPSHAYEALNLLRPKGKVPDGLVPAVPAEVPAARRRNFIAVDGDLSQLTPSQRSAYISLLEVLVEHPNGGEKLRPLSDKLHAEERAELDQKSNPVWECIGRTPGEYGGWSYQFRSPDQFALESQSGVAEHLVALQKYEEALIAMLPAAVPNDSNVIQELNTRDFANARLPKDLRDALDLPEATTWKEAVKARGVAVASKAPTEKLAKMGLALIMRDLGFKVDFQEETMLLSLPDIDALQANWNTLRTRCPELPHLAIRASEGIAGHQSFIETFTTHDLLISEDAEFVHDMLVHVLHRLMAICRHPRLPILAAEQGAEVKAVGKAYGRIMAARHNIDGFREKVGLSNRELDLLMASLAAAIDLHTAKSTWQPLDERAVVDLACSAASDFAFHKLLNDEFSNEFGTDPWQRLPELWTRLEEGTADLYEPTGKSEHE